MILTFKANVKMQSEEDMEQNYDSMGISPVYKWKVTDIAFPSEWIYKIYRYSITKTLLYLRQTEDKEEVILIYEPFQEVLDKWNDSLEEQVSEESEDS